MSRYPVILCFSEICSLCYLSRAMIDRPGTLGELRESGYVVVSVKDEMRRNLVHNLREGRDLFPGILGYDETVIP